MLLLFYLGSHFEIFQVFHHHFALVIYLECAGCGARFLKDGFGLLNRNGLDVFPLHIQENVVVHDPFGPVFVGASSAR